MPDLKSHSHLSFVYYLIVSILIFFGGKLSAQERSTSGSVDSFTVDYDTTSYVIDFPINSYIVDPEFSTNRRSLDSLAEAIAKINDSQDMSLAKILISGNASPDGNLDKNIKLAKRRMLAMHAYITANYGLPQPLVEAGDCDVPWDEFRQMIAATTFPWRDKALEICTTGSDSSVPDATRRMAALKRLDHGAAWGVLKTEILPRLRRSAILQVIAMRVESKPEVVVSEDIATEEIDIAVPVTPEEPVTETAEEIKQEVAETACHRGWHISTNFAEWALLITNLKGEYDVSCHWTAGLSVHYSGVNYFSRDCKFRTFIVRPEMRYWPKRGQRGIFVDAHLQMAYYNFALPSWNYRIQDRDGNTPALGGGLGLGYRFPVGHSGRWALEAQVGAGLYRLKYDRFHNHPNGLLVDTRTRTWFGLDNLALTLVYNFK